MSGPMGVGELAELFAEKGHEHYGEDVTQLEHALQCAALAEADGAEDSLVAAALLHDLGHLVADVQGDGRFDLAVDDDHHEALGARILARMLGPEVAAPVALHVEAKRWRCAVDPGYLAELSATSTATLAAQGGPLDPEGCRRFERHPSHDAALRLRSWDDAGKVEGLELRPFSDYLPLLERLAEEHRG